MTVSDGSDKSNDSFRRHSCLVSRSVELGIRCINTHPYLIVQAVLHLVLAVSQSQANESMRATNVMYDAVTEYDPGGDPR